MNPPPGADATIALTSPAQELAVREMLSELVRWLAALGVSDELRGDIELALSEVLNNIVEHAYAGEEAGQIALAGRYEPPWLAFELADNGAELPGLELPAGAAVDLDVPMDAMPEGGFGWFLIRTLGERLIYRRFDSINHLDISFRASEPDPPQGEARC